MEKDGQDNKGNLINTFYQEKEQHFFSIISDFMDCFVVILDRQGKIVYYNKSCERFTGLLCSEARSRYYWEVFCLPEEREIYKAFFNLLDPSQYPLKIETQSFSQKGLPSKIQWKYNALQVQNDVIDYHILIGIDITKQDNIKKSLFELGEKYRTIIHASPVTVISLDTNFRVKSWSSAAENLLGWPEKNVLDKDISLFLEDQGGILKQSMEKSLQGKVIYNLELVCYRKTGSPVDMHFSLAPIRNYQGKIEGIVLIAFDITQRKQAEERIRYISFHDSLTGLYNRTYLEVEMKRLDTQRQLPISVIMADLNSLKLVNDTYGHKVGDEMLKRAADIIRESCRGEDIIARWGGDEFVVLLPRTAKEEARVICDRIKNNCSNKFVEQIPISMAKGVAHKDSPEKDLEEVFKEAGDHMYRHKSAESRSVKAAIIKSLLNELEKKSCETEEHTRRMQRAAQEIAEEIGLSQVELRRLNLLINLHDIGKINVPEGILNRGSPLTPEEWEDIKKHPETGYRIARATEGFSHVAEEILAHHERWDGTGYPRGLKGEEIPLLSRITAIADAYEVMSYGRPYKKAMTREEVMAELKKCVGNQFDPELVEAFLSILERGGRDERGKR